MKTPFSTTLKDPLVCKLRNLVSCFWIFKEKTKKWHDQRIKRREFYEGEKVLVYNSHLHLFLGKLHSRWYSPFIVVKVFPYGVLELKSNYGNTFQINGHKVKHYEEVWLQVHYIVHLQVWSFPPCHTSGSRR